MKNKSILYGDMDTQTDSKDRTLSARAYRLLRDDIIRGNLRPGTKLKVDKLSEMYGIGIAPMREALSRLAGDSLARTEGQRGYWVKELSQQELDDVNRLRILVETEALERSIRNGDAAWRTEVERTAGALFDIEKGILANGATFDPVSFESWETANRDFHFALVSACNSPTFLEMREMLYARSERYRRVVHRFDPNVYEEHQRIAAAALGNQIASACRMLEAHIAERGNGVARVISSIDEVPGTLDKTAKSGSPR